MNTQLYGAFIVAVLILLDFVSGIVKAGTSGTLSSEKMRVGLGHKFTYGVVLFLAWLIEFSSPRINLGFDVPLFIPTVIGVALIEIASILENCIAINPDLKNSKLLALFDKVTSGNE